MPQELSTSAPRRSLALLPLRLAFSLYAAALFLFMGIGALLLATVLPGLDRRRAGSGPRLHAPGNEILQILPARAKHRHLPLGQPARQRTEIGTVGSERIGRQPTFHPHGIQKAGDRRIRIRLSRLGIYGRIVRQFPSRCRSACAVRQTSLCRQKSQRHGGRRSMVTLRRMAM